MGKDLRCGALAARLTGKDGDPFVKITNIQLRLDEEPRLDAHLRSLVDVSIMGSGNACACGRAVDPVFQNIDL